MIRFSFVFFALTLFCSSHAETSTFSLKKDGKTVAKLEGSFSFQILHSNETITINLSQINIESIGSQSDKETIFQLKPIQIEGEKLKFEGASLVFSKSDQSAVFLESVQLNYSTPADNKNHQSIDWKEKIPLSSTSSQSFQCSVVEAENNKNIFRIQNARLQPFDLQNEDFGTAEICPRDQKTTTAPPAPTPAPTPAPSPVGWIVVQDGFSCIHVSGNITLQITYPTKSGTNATASVSVPSTATVDRDNSSCSYNKTLKHVDGNEQTLQLDFVLNGKDWFLDLKFTNDSKFTHDKSGATVQVYQVTLGYYLDDGTFPNASQPESYYTLANSVNVTSGEGALALFKSDTTHHYRCNSEEPNEVVPGLFKMTTQNLKAEAFLNNSTRFLEPERVCGPDEEADTSDLVPIITGAALAALVLFVLIAYLVGRARAKQTTYETI